MDDLTNMDECIESDIANLHLAEILAPKHTEGLSEK